ncbi:MAG: hypothetical protein ABI456_18630 [Ktedonobacteraceae bacterium]|nr:hypothetical protein [Chloroflexota bacterium]
MKRDFSFLPDDSFDLDNKRIAARALYGVLLLRQEDIRLVGQVELTVQAQWDLLEWLYARRAALYRATHGVAGNADIPDWVASDHASSRRVVDASGDEST